MPSARVGADTNAGRHEPCGDFPARVATTRGWRHHLIPFGIRTLTRLQSGHPSMQHESSPKGRLCAPAILDGVISAMFPCSLMHSGATCCSSIQIGLKMFQQSETQCLKLEVRPHTHWLANVGADARYVRLRNLTCSENTSSAPTARLGGTVHFCTRYFGHVSNVHCSITLVLLGN